MIKKKTRNPDIQKSPEGDEVKKSETKPVSTCVTKVMILKRDPKPPVQQQPSQPIQPSIKLAPTNVQTHQTSPSSSTTTSSIPSLPYSLPTNPIQSPNSAIYSSESSRNEKIDSRRTTQTSNPQLYESPKKIMKPTRDTEKRGPGLTSDPILMTKKNIVSEDKQTIPPKITTPEIKYEIGRRNGLNQNPNSTPFFNLIDKSFSVVQNHLALEKLSKEIEHMTVVSILGTSKSGKSLIASHVFESTSVFTTFSNEQQWTGNEEKSSSNNQTDLKSILEAELQSLGLNRLIPENSSPTDVWKFIQSENFGNYKINQFCGPQNKSSQKKLNEEFDPSIFLRKPIIPKNAVSKSEQNQNSNNSNNNNGNNNNNGMNEDMYTTQGVNVFLNDQSVLVVDTQAVLSGIAVLDADSRLRQYSQDVNCACFVQSLHLSLFAANVSDVMIIVCEKDVPESIFQLLECTETLRHSVTPSNDPSLNDASVIGTPLPRLVFVVNKVEDSSFINGKIEIIQRKIHERMKNSGFCRYSESIEVHFLPFITESQAWEIKAGRKSFATLIQKLSASVTNGSSRALWTPSMSSFENDNNSKNNSSEQNSDTNLLHLNNSQSNNNNNNNNENEFLQPDMIVPTRRFFSLRQWAHHALLTWDSVCKSTRVRNFVSYSNP